MFIWKALNKFLNHDPQAIDDSHIPTLEHQFTYDYTFSHLPENLIQAQRDYIGAHTYQWIDREGVFHPEWKGNSS